MGKIEQDELKIYIDNDGTLYQQMTLPIYKNLQKKKQKGVYQEVGATKAFLHLSEAGAKKYAKENASPNDWNKIFTTEDRKEVAKELAKDFESEYESGNRY